MAFTTLFQPGFRLFTGEQFNNIFNGITAVPKMVLSAVTLAGTVTTAAQLLTAAGTTQLGAAAILASTGFALITVSTTASTHGVRLPVPAAVGQIIQIGNNGTFGVKVYPATNGQIGAASTNSADSTVLAINKINEYVAVSATKWIVDRGA